MKNLNWLVVVCFGAALLGGLIGGGIVITLIERPVVRIPSEVIVRTPTEGSSGTGAIPEEVEAEGTNVVGSIILIAALVLLVIGIAVLTIKLSRH